jgi:hypothetical protein
MLAMTPKGSHNVLRCQAYPEMLYLCGFSEFKGACIAGADDDTLITRGVATSRQMLAPVLQPVRRKLKPPVQAQPRPKYMHIDKYMYKRMFLGWN